MKMDREIMAWSSANKIKKCELNQECKRGLKNGKNIAPILKTR